MKVLFYTKKGGQGKTTHSVGYAHYSNSIIYTNDFNNGTLEVYGGLFSDGRMRSFVAGEEIEVNEDDNLVFDMGGYVDNRIIQIASFVDICVVPIYYQSSADLIPSAQTILELEKYNKNIAILINNTDKEYIEEVKKALEKRFSYPIFVISKSKYINRLADENKTIFDLFNSGGLEKYMLKNLMPQIKNLYSYLDNFNGNKDE